MITQVLINGVIAASTWVLVALGFSLIYYTSRFFHFAHGAVFMAGAYFTLIFNMFLGIWLLPSMLLSIASSALLGCLMYLFIYHPLERRRASPLILMLSSLGIFIVVENIISLVFGNEIKIIRSGLVEEGFPLWGARITSVHILIVCVSVFLVVATGVLLRTTKVGKAMRAVANNRELAKVCGVESYRVILWSFIVGSALAGLAGVLMALDVHMSPAMGLNAIMMGVVVTIIGGIGSVPGVALAALLLGMAQHLGVWMIGSQWQDAIAFVILLVFLVFKPEGFMGKKIRKAVV